MDKLQEHSLLTSLTTASLWGVNYADEVCEKNRHGNKLIINDVRKPILQSFPPSSYTILSSTRLIKRGMLLSSFFFTLSMSTQNYGLYNICWWCLPSFFPNIEADDDAAFQRCLLLCPCHPYHWLHEQPFWLRRPSF